ncbi:sugar ABC transporter ATP-binding protein [Fodinisporobacter ferrooxydans]|uniref:Ribose/galactose/methyl galactoside import ATP-binding protein n=1 Tax=Fodinisporobacter ferrooxydans TaxID=2901836 RepID=A0ABY4CJ83_9BACL|nr:sugar ABC transporter ATP-binding protein [Alicyclobacillaceae bacterium MYW30-H2]
MEQQYVLEMDGICKAFSGVQALKNARLQVRKGTVHALMGENGAGKSTLMKILVGIYKPDAGSIRFKGKDLHLRSIHDSLHAGISMIHQELSSIPNMTVAENIFLGREPTLKSGWIDFKKLYRDCEELFAKLNMNIAPTVKMKELSVANRQLVEIAKAISYKSDLIIMDEPTSAITEREVEHLFQIIASLKKDGVSIIYITHKMSEVFMISDDITVFRDGQFVESKPARELTNSRLIQLMVGREINQTSYRQPSSIQEVILSVRNLTCPGKFKNVSFEVRRGEVLGFAGLMGSGRTEVMESLFGIRPAESGEIMIHGNLAKIKKPSDAIRYGLGMLTEDRKETGCFLPLSVQDNMMFVSIDKFARFGFLDKKRIDQSSDEQRKLLSVKTPNLNQIIGKLSGGNQQKVLLARWLLNDPDILILDEPTRGIDIGSKFEIYKLINELTSKGKAVIVVSSELPEVLGISDRIVVMSAGQVAGELDGQSATQERIMEFATSLIH